MIQIIQQVVMSKLQNRMFLIAFHTDTYATKKYSYEHVS